ncbi:MAG: tRNA (N6-threonylcarbamoyladenosine(37)-N6)-methyltransferase TrmO [Clostridia bacterium]|nr:tRNA (N6-threonylcarbamoyladenosine(37)-N6)-methyltransferase TrmO [Clostridia bacterium]
MKIELEPIALIENPLGGKFGLPRQASLVPELESKAVFFPEFSAPEAFREIDGFSHVWLIWGFSLSGGVWHPTVRPPRLGGNKRVGVFASRSPFRPNPLGLSCVKLVSVSFADGRAILTLGGADLADGTPIYDVKPYVPYADCVPDAAGGWANAAPGPKLKVFLSPALRERLGAEDAAALTALLSQDPRPAYQDDPERVYALEWKSLTVCFRVENGVLTTTDEK